MLFFDLYERLLSASDISVESIPAELPRIPAVRLCWPLRVFAAVVGVWGVWVDLRLRLVQR